MGVCDRLCQSETSDGRIKRERANEPLLLFRTALPAAINSSCLLRP